MPVDQTPEPVQFHTLRTPLQAVTLANVSVEPVTLEPRSMIGELSTERAPVESLNPPVESVELPLRVRAAEFGSVLFAPRSRVPPVRFVVPE